MENVYGKPRGRQNRGERVSQSEKNQVRAGVIMSRLARNALGTLTDNQGNPLQLTASQIKASEIFLAKTVPSLSAVEQTNHEEQQTPEQLMTMLKALVTESPETRHMLKQLIADTEADVQIKAVK